jgi:FkbM family methyltransferase
MRPYYYLGENRALTQLANGLPFFVNTHDEGIASWIILGGRWEDFVDNILCEMCFPGAMVVDAGANLGYYTVKSGNLVRPNGHVYAFEPNPELFPFLQRNIAINGFHSICTAYNLALGSKVDALNLSFSYSNMGGGYIQPAELGNENLQQQRHYPVKIQPLDELVPENVTVDLMKIDVEGFEPELLRGAKRMISRSPNLAVIFEFSPAAWSRFGEPATFLSLFAEQGAAFFHIDHSGTIDPVTADTLVSKAEAFGGMIYVLAIKPTDSRFHLIGKFRPVA